MMTIPITLGRPFYTHRYKKLHVFIHSTLTLTSNDLMRCLP